MKKITLLFVLLSFFCYSQNFEWSKAIGINWNLNPDFLKYPIIVDNSGYIYISGYKDTQYLSGALYGNVFYTKYDTMGNIVFSKIFAGKIIIKFIKVDSSNNVYVGATVKDSIQIDNTLISTSSKEDLILKFDSTGNLIWNVKINTLLANTSLELEDIAFDNSNNAFIAVDNFTNSYVAKLNSTNGTLISTITQSDVKIISSISIDSDSNIYCAGSCATQMSVFSDVSSPTNFLYNSYLVKYNSSGAFQWVKFVQDISCGNTQKVVAFSPNEIYFASNLNGPFSFDSITLNGNDFYLSKLNSSGSFIWVKEVPNGQTGYFNLGSNNFLTTTTNGNIIIVGKTQNTIQWNTNITTTGFGGYAGDLIATMYNPNGDVLFSKVAGNNSYDKMDSVTTFGNAIYCGGVVSGSANFDSISISSPNSSPTYPFVAKITIPNLETNLFSNSTFFTNNPVEDYVIFSNNSYHNHLANIYNIQGKLIMSATVSQNQLNVSSLIKGMYFLQLDNAVFKLVKM